MSYRLLNALCLAAGLFITLPAGAEENEANAPDSAIQAEKSTPELTEEAKKEAAERFQRGLSFYEDGDYGLALIEFERAYQLVPDYRVLYNIGQVSIQLSRSSQALRALRAYLEQGGDALSEERVEAVNRDLEMLHARTAHLVLKGTEGAEVMIDDESYGTLPLDGPLLLDAGRHKLEVRKEGFRDYSERLTLAGAEERRISVQLEEKPTATPVVDPDPVSTPEQSPRDSEEPPARRRGGSIALIGWSATGALAGGAILSGIMGLSSSRRLSNLKSEPDPSRSELDGQARTTKTWFAAADILTVAAVATGGASLYFSLSGKSKNRQAGLSFRERAATDVRVTASPRAFGVSGRF